MTPATTLDGGAQLSNGQAQASTQTGSNGATSSYRPARPLVGGVYAPVVTPFGQDEELDFEAWRKHIVRMAQSGVGLCVLGTNGEATHLSAQERFQVINEARKALDAADLPNAHLIAGTGSGSTKETIEHCVAAAEAGADSVIVVFPSYYAGLGMPKTAVRDYFLRVAESSPLPVIVYNFPPCAGGVDMNSDDLIEISQHPNVVGAKMIASALKTQDFARMSEAQKLSQIVAAADWCMVKGGISGTKWALGRYYYDFGNPREPLQPCSEATSAMLETGLAELMVLERELERKSGAAQVARA
ncbi:unnamed protein product [Jaminaea pallidilutea]